MNMPVRSTFRPNTVRTVSTTVRLPFEMLDDVMKFAEENQTSQSNAIRFLVEAGLLAERKRKEEME